MRGLYIREKEDGGRSFDVTATRLLVDERERGMGVRERERRMFLWLWNREREKERVKKDLGLL